MVPESAFFALNIKPNELIKNPKLSAFPREIVSAVGVQQMGFDPMLIEDATLLFTDCEAGGFEEPPRFAVIMRFSEMQGLSGDMIEGAEETTVKGFKAYLRPNYPDGKVGFLIYDESTMLFGESSFMEEVVSSNQGDLARLMKNKSVNGEIMGFLHMKPFRRFLDPLLEELPEFSQPVEDMKELPELLESVSFGTTTTGRLETKIIMMAKNADDAEDAKEIIVNGLDFFHAYMITELKSSMDMEDPVQVATIQYVNRIWEKYEPKMTPDVRGRKLTVTLHEEILALPLLSSTGYRMSREINVNMMSTQNRARMLALATLNYESAHRKLPPHTVYDEDGQPLYSGRVNILPFLEQSNLYEKFNRDERWDSKNNRELSETKIETFSSLKNRGMIRLPVFPGSVWDSEEGISLGQITDGTSNTILGIEAAPGNEVSWADPTPWTISEKNPMRDVFGDRDEVTAVFVDGSTHVLKKSSMTNEKLKALLTRGGGEIVDRF